jgi:hypothetical protein
MRVPFAANGPGHRAGVELAAIDAHRAAEGRPTSNVDSMMVFQARRRETSSK